jgi:twinfilin-like protein
MLYSSSRHSLTKSLGSAVFTDSIFATSKEDLTPQAYASHKRHRAAPQPLSAREQELADVRAAEREAGGGAYEGSSARKNHIGKAIGFSWSPELEEAMKELGEGEGSRLVVIVSLHPPCRIFADSKTGFKCIDTSSEILNLHSAADISVEELGSALPSAEPCMSTVRKVITLALTYLVGFAFFAWSHNYSSPPRREIGTFLDLTNTSSF